jgi:hypothetical protein
MKGILAGLVLLGATATPSLAHAGWLDQTIVEGARTGGVAVRDGAWTFGRSVRALFKHGPNAAQRTWDENAARTSDEVRQAARRTSDAAKGN